MTVAERINSACAQFEADWRDGRRPTIEAYVERSSDPERNRLLQSLLVVEWNLLARAGQKPDLAAYHRRFPADAELVTAVYREATKQRSTQRGPQAAQDTSIASRSESGKSLEATAPVGPAPAPEKIGRFEIRRILGTVAFGRVYLARDPTLLRDVAIKVPLVDRPDAEPEMERFLREARVAATLHHPNICPVYEVGQDGPRHYIVMAYVPGKSLSDYLEERKEPLPPRQVAVIVRKLALALETAHARGIIHRDLKPGNVMLDKDRKDVVIMDFGLARAPRPDDAVATQSGVIMGTPAYMSPEQARGDVRAISPRSDIYSLGVILYEMLAGERPFTGPLAVVLGCLLHREPDPPSKLRAGVDARLEAICLHAMAKDPAARYATMKHLAAALDEYLKDGDRRASPPPVEDPVKQPFAEMVAAMSAERRAETATTVEQVVVRHGIPRWTWLAGAGFAAALVLLGILFFARLSSGTATVYINVEVDLKDPALRFVLDGKGATADSLAKPVELTVGDHELIVMRGDDVVKQVKFTVKGGPNPEFKVKEVTPGPAPPAKPTEPSKDVTPPPPPTKPVEPSPERASAPKPTAFVPYPGYSALFNGADLTGWRINGNIDAFRFNAAEGVLVALPSQPISLLETVRDYADFHMRFEFRVVTKDANSGINLRQPANAAERVQLQVQVRDDSTSYVNAQTGSIYWSKDAKSYLRREREDLCNPFGEWNQMEIIAQGPKVRVLVNGKQALLADLATVADRPEALPGLKQLSGRIAIEAYRGEVWYRRMEIRELKPSAVPAAPVKPPVAAVPAEAGFVSLFNGRNLTGWKTHPASPGNWRVENGVLIGSGDAVSHLFSERGDYTDVHFRVEAKINAGGNSGQYIRTTFAPGFPKGYEAQINSTLPDLKTGSLYGFVKVDKTPVGPDEWFTQEIIAVGNHLTVKVNGQTTADFIDAKQTYKQGHLALQMHDPRTVVHFRRIEVRELKPTAAAAPAGEAGFVPLFNSRDFTGWQGELRYWRIENGTIIGEVPSSRNSMPKNTFLRTARPYRDFELRLEVKMEKGNSGIQVRSNYTQTHNFTTMLGPQVEIAHNTTYPWSSLVTEPAGRPDLKADPTLVAKVLRPDDFNSMHIRCTGRHITITLNGFTTVDGDFPTMPNDGLIGLQLHKGHPGMRIEFRTLRIREY